MNRPAALDARKAAALPDSFVEGTLPGRFREAVERFGERLAVDDDIRALSYSELDTESDHLAQSIVRCVGGPETVCILAGQGADLVTAILAVLKSGCAYVPVDPSEALDEIRAIIADAGCRLLVCDKPNEKLASLVASEGTRCLTIGALLAGASPEPGSRPPREVALSPDDNAYIYYTSGTTGRPKGVFDIHRNVLHNVLRYTNSLAIGHDDRLSLIQAGNFSGTVSTIFSALLNGAALFPFDFRRQGVARLAQRINEAGITMFHGVPLIFEQLMETGLHFPSIRLLRLEGDRMLPRHLALFKQRFVEDCILVNGLASTETGLVRQNFFTPVSDNSASVVAVGYPVRDMEVSIRLADGSTASQMEIGEIVVRSRFLSKGYWRRPDLTATRFEGSRDHRPDGYYRTGDLGRILPGGCLEHLGRDDSTAKIRGRLADLAAVEHALCRLPRVRHALVTVDDGPAVEQLIAYVVKDGPADLGASDLRRALVGAVPGWLIPAHFAFLDVLPVDRHGKVSRHLLPARSEERPQLGVPYRAPKSVMEKALARSFADVLQVRPVGIDDNFFDLGGDSLSATALAFEIEKKFEVDVPAELVFAHPTVARLLSHLRDHKLVAAAYPIRSTGSLPPLFCVHVYNHLASGYRRLADLLGEEQPVYVLRDCPPLASAEEIAASYVQAMRKVQPSGPYRLCGLCFSGTIAYEMARQLQAAGEAVGFLGLLDSAFPPRKAGSSPYPAAVARTSRWRHMSRSRLAKLAINLGLPFFRSWLKLHHAIEIAESRYRPAAISCDVTLFIIGEMDNQAGWQKLCGDRLAIVPVAGSSAPHARHRPHPTDEPYVAGLAREVTRCLRA